MLYTPSHAELAQHPKTRKLARLLGVSIPTALGHLHLLWHFALKYAQDGDLARFDCDEIADGCLWEGAGERFTGALIEAGWLDMATDGAAAIHDWGEHGGKLVHRKEANAARMREARAKQPEGTPRPRATHVQRTNAARVEPEERRGEKRREEESIPPSKPPTPMRPAPAPPDGGVKVRAAPKPRVLSDQQQERFAQFYQAYPNKQHRPEAESAWRKLDPDAGTYEQIIMDIAERRQGRKWAEGYIEHPATYLNARVWEDDIAPARAAPARASPNGHPADPLEAQFGVTTAKSLRNLERVMRGNHAG